MLASHKKLWYNECIDCEGTRYPSICNVKAYMNKVASSVLAEVQKRFPEKEMFSRGDIYFTGREMGYTESKFKELFDAEDERAREYVYEGDYESDEDWWTANKGGYEIDTTTSWEAL